MSNNRDEIRFLALFLDAPMQSWGVASKFDLRTTLPFPSRAALTGMIAAAMGIARDDRAQLAELGELAMTMIGFRDRSGLLLRDYHTVGGGKSAPRSQPATAGGKPRGTVISEREFLTDAKFGVVVSGAEAMLRRIETALHDPVWGIWFGRKSCVPCSPVARGVFGNEPAAFAALETAAGAALTVIWREASLTDPASDLYADKPVDFSTREFALRAIQREFLEMGEAADGADLSESSD